MFIFEDRRLAYVLQPVRRMKEHSLKLTAVIALLFGMLTFSGCQTVKGAGKDIEKAGEGIQNSADKHS
jgi:predicted small secreted protein